MVSQFSEDFMRNTIWSNRFIKQLYCVVIELPQFQQYIEMVR